MRYLLNKETERFGEIDIEEFMVTHFRKPNATSNQTLNANDKGVTFLKSLKAKGLVGYDDIALSHVNHWTIEGGADGKTKRWFDTLHEPLLVSRNFTFSEVPFRSRLLNRKFVLQQIKYATIKAAKYALKLFIAFWKYFVLTSSAFIAAYLATDNHYKFWWRWFTSLFTH